MPPREVIGFEYHPQVQWSALPEDELAVSLVSVRSEPGIDAGVLLTQLEPGEPLIAASTWTRFDGGTSWQLIHTTDHIEGWVDSKFIQSK